VHLVDSTKGQHVTWTLVCHLCARRREVKTIGVMRSAPQSCAACGTELPAMANGLSDGSPVHDDELGEIRRERLLASIRDRWTGNRVVDLRGVPLEQMEEAEREHDQESQRRFERAQIDHRRGLRIQYQ
jgi:hypothetical protein